MPYTHFRFIAYEVPTATFPVGAGDPVCDYDAGDAYQAIARLPVPPANPAAPDDARKRLLRFAGVVNFAANRLRAVGDNAATLKIFMAPEFYFRPPAALGAGYFSGTYPRADVNTILDALNGMFVHADFQHWLFVPGTVLWNTRDDPKAPPLYFNTLTYVRGGLPDQLNVIEKNQPSNIDGMPTVGVPGRDPQYRLFHQSWRNRKKRVGMVAGTPMGFDVCLDHRNSPTSRIVKNVLHDWPAEEGNQQEISLHLLSAAGMGIKDRSVGAKANGYILRNDGLALRIPSARSEMKKIVGYTAPGPILAQRLPTTASDLQGTAAMGAAIALDQDAALPDGPLRVPSKGAGFTVFPQRVVFYPTQPLP